VQLPPVHPVRLGLVLNLCVFLDEVLQIPDQATRLAAQVRRTQGGASTADA
jgi:hypothetical protein